MSNVLLLTTEDYTKFNDPMIVASKTILAAHKLSWNECTIPSVQEIGSVIQPYYERNSYEGVVVVGCMHKPSPDVGVEYMYRAIIQQIYDFAAFNGVPISMNVYLVNNKTSVDQLLNSVAHSIEATCQMIGKARKFANFENIYYSQSANHH